MQIICRKRLHFQDHEIVKNEQTKEKVALLKAQHLVAPSIHPQEVPDWIRNNDLFRFGIEDGSITEVKVLSTPKKSTAAKPSKEIPESQQQEDPAQAGWGATAGAGLPNGNTIGDGNK